MATSTETYSRKYARAFLKALNPADTAGLKKTQEELETLSLLSKEPFDSFFLNPVFNLEEKKAVLEDIFSKHQFRVETKQFVDTLLSFDQLSLMATIGDDFSAELRDKNEETKVEVSSAYPLSTDEQKKIKETFEKRIGNKILLDVNVDRDLIGGIRAKVGGVIYDSSIQGHLLRLQKEFSL